MRNIRSATPADAQQMLEIYRPYVLETPISFELVVPSSAEFQRRVSEGMEKFPWLVCEIDREIVGYAYAGRFRERAAYAWSVESSIYVRTECRGMAIGKELYGSLLELLKEQGIVNVIGGLTLPNEASQRLHEHFGFAQVAHYKDIGFKFGRWWDVGLWQLQFPKPDTPISIKPPRIL